MSVQFRRGLLCLLFMLSPWLATAEECAEWARWQAFSSRFIQTDGRVLADESEQHYSTSEGQAYALFFALVANDRKTFERVLFWTSANLAAGDLSARLPAWQWGKRQDGSWGVVDANSASDADTWLAYTLLEAGRLWHEPRYSAYGNLMLANIRLHLIRDFPGLGAMLLPGAVGFNLNDGGARFNLSYYPVQLLRVFAKAEPTGPWNELIVNSLKLMRAATPKGFAPDWQAYVPGTGFIKDPVLGANGSHDAIRVYLWWGMLAKQDAAASGLKEMLYGMNKLISNQEVTPPLNVDAQTAAYSGNSPPGFSAALLPYLATMKNKRALSLQNDRLIANETAGLIGEEARYYDQVLTLFGQGWMERRFSFSPQGQLLAQWNPSCSAKK
ncbi:MAG: endo-1,4-D-glucanase [Gallionellales bacterium RIFOXYB12_FULL_54_9]|nr:MAG: endo-1,4-D-glucanase [Gallionellales bacterium RIFOXYB12_FULL_54_9]